MPEIASAERPIAVRTLRNHIGGGWVEAAAEGTLEDRDPATGELSALIPLSGADDVDAAVRAAAEAQREWRDVAPQRRARAVIALREALWERREELGRLTTADMGKTLDDARGEVLRGIESTEAACAIPHLLKGENLEGVARGVDVELVRQPVGVVAAITPFNFPVMIPLWFLPFAIACGNGFVLKPSERDPRPSELIFELIDAIDELPDGVCNLVHGAHDAVNGAPRPPGDRRGLVRRSGVDGALHSRALGRQREALPGPGRGEELTRRDARRRPRGDRAGDHVLGLRRRRPALPGRLGGVARGPTRAPGRGAGRAAGRRGRARGRPR